jgi:hypothetical protein
VSFAALTELLAGLRVLEMGRIEDAWTLGGMTGEGRNDGIVLSSGW